MFTIDSEARVIAYPANKIWADTEDSGSPVRNAHDLSYVIATHPGEWSVRLWNQLPGVTPIHTPPGEKTVKFRNKATAVERIWSKLCELYPDAVNSEDMPKVKERHASTNKKAASPGRVKRHTAATATNSRSAGRNQNHAGNGRKSAWAEELTTELRKRFNPGQEFALSDVYKLIPGFQRRHPENKHVAARLRATVAQDLRGAGIVKSLKRGLYRMVAA